jgi:hypothetical protein
MIILKLTALCAAGAGSIAVLFSTDLGPDLVLAALCTLL